MAAAMIHFLPVAPHQLWQTAASPFILPSQWQTMYQRCPRCGGNAPNICDEVWPEKWWEDDMLGLMYQGHIPPTQRVSPWEAYYAKSRVQYPVVYPAPQPLRIDPYYHQPHHEAQAPPITPPATPGVPTHVPYYVMPRPASPASPTLTYNRQGTFNTVSSFESAHSSPSQVMDLDPKETARQRLARHLRRLGFLF